MSWIASRYRTLAFAFGTALAITLLPPVAAHEVEGPALPPSPPTADEVEPALAECGPDDRPETGLQGQVPPEEREGPDGFRGFWCNIRKVAQHTIFDRGRGGTPTRWGDCAYYSNRGRSSMDNIGTAVLDLQDPTQPEVVRFLTEPGMIASYAFLEVRSGILAGSSGEGGNDLSVYDVSEDCRDPQHLSDFELPYHDTHDAWLTDDGKTFYGIPWMAPSTPQGAPRPGGIDLAVVSLDDPTEPELYLTWDRSELPPAEYARTAAAAGFHDASTNADGTRLYLALYGNVFAGATYANGLVILDSSDIAERAPDPELRFISFLSWYDDPLHEYWPPVNGSAHSTEYVIHENGKEYIVTTDEGTALFGGAAVCAQRTYTRLIDISDETNPRIVATWHPEVNDLENCDTIRRDNLRYMPHYLGFDDRYNMRLVFYASYSSGLRVVDYRDPENPREVAYYNAPRNPENMPVNGVDVNAPDVQYDPRHCHIHTGWTDNGFIILELTDPGYNACLRDEAGD